MTPTARLPYQRARYRRIRNAQLCVDCCWPAIPGASRCDDCRRLHALASLARKPAKGIYRCGECGEHGHNARRCDAVRSAA